MTDTPRLKEMGITSPDEIASYSVSTVDFTDYLRIVYERPRGSLLPVSRSYRFPQIQRTHSATGKVEDEKTVMESSKAFREAVAELRALCDSRATVSNVTADMLDILRRMEQESTTHYEQLRALIAKIDKS